MATYENTKFYIFLSRRSYLVKVTFNSFVKIQISNFVDQSTPIQDNKIVMCLNLKWVYART